MNTEKAKQAIGLADMTKELPKSDNMVSVGSMLSENDNKFIDEYAIGRICVQIGEEMFFLNKLHSIPAEAKLVRQDEGQHVGEVIGIPAIVGG